MDSKSPSSTREWVQDGYRLVRRRLPKLPGWAKWILGLIFTAVVSVLSTLYAEELENSIPAALSLGDWLGDVVLGIPTLILLFAWVIYRQRKIRRQLTDIEESVDEYRTDGGGNSEGILVVLLLGGLAGAAVGSYFGDGIEVLGGAMLGAYFLYVYDQNW